MRGALGAEARAKAHDQAIARLLGKTDPAAAIAAYWPLAEEFDLRPALLVLVARGQHVGRRSWRAGANRCLSAAGHPA